MARKFISTAQFNPYSYQELAAPVQRATAILAQQAQGLTALEMQNEELGRYLDPTLDGTAYQQYVQHQDDLKKASEQLLRYGVTTNTYNALRNASLTYARDIKPLMNAVNTRINWTSKIAEYMMSHPDVALKGSINRPIDQFYNGIPQAEFVSGEAIQKDVAMMAGLLAQAKDVRMTKQRWSDYQDVVRTTHGYTLPELEQAKQPGSMEYYMMQQILQKHGVIDQNNQSLMNNQQDYERMLQYANEGLNSLLGKQEVTIRDNDLEKRQNAYYHEQSLALQRARAAKSGTTGNKLAPNITTRNVNYSKNGRTVGETRELVMALPTKNIKGTANALVNLISTNNPHFANKDIERLYKAKKLTILLNRENDQERGNRANSWGFVVECDDGQTPIELQPTDLGFTAEDWTRYTRMSNNADNPTFGDLLWKYKHAKESLNEYDKMALQQGIRDIYATVWNAIEVYYSGDADYNDNDYAE